MSLANRPMLHDPELPIPALPDSDSGDVGNDLCYDEFIDPVFVESATAFSASHSLSRSDLIYLSKLS